MRLSELIAHAEGLIDTVRDFHRGSEALVDRMNTVAVVAPNVAEAMQVLGRRNGALKREVKELRKAFLEERELVDGLGKAGEGMRHQIMVLRDRAESAERRTEAHRATIDQLQQELGNPTDGKTTSANTDGK